MLSTFSRTALRRAALTRVAPLFAKNADIQTFVTTSRVSVAKIQIAGVVGNDIEVIETQNGTQIGNYSVASGPQGGIPAFQLVFVSRMVLISR
jgi:hypothetical protein